MQIFFCVVRLRRLVIGVQSTEEVGDSEIGEENEEERHDAGYVVRSVVFGAGIRFDYYRPMEECGIDDHGDERPGLLRVPAPVPAP